MGVVSRDTAGYQNWGEGDAQAPSGEAPCSAQGALHPQSVRSVHVLL